MAWHWSASSATFPGYGETPSALQLALRRDGAPVTGQPPPPGRLSAAQAIGWGLAFLLIATLIVLFFTHAGVVRPLLSQGPEVAWPLS